jgi:aryl-alcohol dehydrogenase-like predicted oxidoreductase
MIPVMDLLRSRRPLGGSGLSVSPLSLGSWRTFERIGFDASLAIFERARALGVTFLDDARYDDETGTAEIATGYSELLFGRLLTGSRWPRDEVVIANKLWWEHWPQEDACAELRGSLERMGLERVDLIYAVTPPADLSVSRAVEEIARLLRAGLARSWGVANWSAQQLGVAVNIASRMGLPPPAAVQLPYNLVDRDHVENAAMRAVLRASGASVVPSSVLAGGLLTGKYLAGVAGPGRMAGAPLEDDGARAALTAAGQLAALATELETSPAQLALAFALDAPRAASVLFGATSVEQLEHNLGALELHHRLGPAARARLGAIGRTPART